MIIFRHIDKYYQRYIDIYLRSKTSYVNLIKLHVDDREIISKKCIQAQKNDLKRHRLERFAKRVERILINRKIGIMPTDNDYEALMQEIIDIFYKHELIRSR